MLTNGSLDVLCGSQQPGSAFHFSLDYNAYNFLQLDTPKVWRLRTTFFEKKSSRSNSTLVMPILHTSFDLAVEGCRSASAVTEGVAGGTGAVVEVAEEEEGEDLLDNFTTRTPPPTVKATWTAWSTEIARNCAKALAAAGPTYQQSCVDFVLAQLASRVDNHIHRQRLLHIHRQQSERDASGSGAAVPASSSSSSSSSSTSSSPPVSTATIDDFSVATREPLATASHIRYHLNGRRALLADVCAEPLWCGHHEHMQQRLLHWQNPSPWPVLHLRDGDAADADAQEMQMSSLFDLHHVFADDPEHCRHPQTKFLVYRLHTYKKGIGSFLHIAATMLRYAACLGRVLYLLPHGLEETEARWRHAGCVGGLLDCYFLPVTGCVLSRDEIDGAPWPEQTDLSVAPWRDHRVLGMKGLPMQGHCTLCGDAWTGNFTFFDGAELYRRGYYVNSLYRGKATSREKAWGPQVREHEIAGEAEASFFVNQKYQDLWYMNQFTSSTKLLWQSAMVRYLLRPRDWFADALRDIVRSRLVSAPPPSSPSPAAAERAKRGFFATPVPEDSIPSPYVSLHLRFGGKRAEVGFQPLARYMRVLAYKYPHARNVFVSTETAEAIGELAKAYPSYRFFYLDYERVQHLPLGNDSLEGEFASSRFPVDWSYEFIYSFANLYVATEAQGFVGTLSSNWCTLIMELERSRGDGGGDYHSLDRGSSMTSCI